MRWSKISIVTPSYNQGHFIEQTIKSVLDQNYPNLEYIIQDGGSSDQTLKILKKYQGKLKYISTKDRGQTDAINRGFEKSTGEILAYLNADDLLLPGSLKTIANFFINNPKNLWVTGECINIDKNSRPIRPLIKKYKDWWLHHYSYSTLLILNYICQPATFWRRSSWQKAGPLRQNLHYVMDYDYWLRLGRLSTPGIIEKPLAAFRIHGTSKSSKGFRTQLKEGYQVVGQFTTNPLIKIVHQIHDQATILVYSVLQ